MDSAKPALILRDAPAIRFPGADAGGGKPGETDCNSPAYWHGETLYVLNSAGHPWRNGGPDLAHLDAHHERARYDNEVSGGRWIESAWQDDDGTLYGWYHNEPLGVCPERKDRHLTAPRIGAAYSLDSGLSWHDRGFVLEAPLNTLRCDTENYYFAGGNGDFSVILDRKREYFYFLVSTYWDPAEQGVAVARMRYGDRKEPAGKVRKWRNGRWDEAGIGGRVTPIFPAKVDWHRKDADAFWGPSVHWNTHLERYVMLLNRAKDWRWAQEGIYVSYNPDIADPRSWTEPARIMAPPSNPGWYPQVVGIDAAKRETDKLAGRVARLFVHGESRWEAVFLRPGERDG